MEHLPSCFYQTAIYINPNDSLWLQFLCYADCNLPCVASNVQDIFTFKHFLGQQVEPQVIFKNTTITVAVIFIIVPIAIFATLCS